MGGYRTIGRKREREKRRKCKRGREMARGR